MSTNNLISILHNESYCVDSNLNDLRTLLHKSADPNKISVSLGIAAMHLAAAKDYSTMQLLLQFGGNPNILNSDHLTPLLIASSWGHYTIINLLLQHGADVNLLDMEGKTPYDYAAEEKHYECACLLKSHIITSINKEYKNTTANTAFDSFSSVSNVKSPPTSPGQSITKQVFDILEERKHNKKMYSPEVSDIVLRSRSLQHTLLENHNTKSCASHYEHDLHLNKQADFVSTTGNKELVSHPHSKLQLFTDVHDDRFSLRHVNSDRKVADFILSSDSFKRQCSLSTDSDVEQLSISATNDSASTYTTCCEVLDSSQIENINSNETDNYQKVNEQATVFGGTNLFPNSSPHTNKANNLFMNNLHMKTKGLQKTDHILDPVMNKPLLLDDSIFSTITIHHDAESDITFLEKHLASDISDDEQADYSAKNLLFSDGSQKKISKVDNGHKPTLSDSVSPKDVTLQQIPKHLLNLTCQEISHRLNSYGEQCGPVTHLTKNAYLRKLAILEKKRSATVNTKQFDQLLGYPSEMGQALKGIFDDCGMNELETEMSQSFNTYSGKWREGTEKSSFTYILLDPLITQNLPLRAKVLSTVEVFQSFLFAIFYIGKGKASRPYSHLNEACSQLTKKTTQIVNLSRKVQKILNIWESGYGVVSVNCFHSTIPAEAYTREACMIEAIGLKNLTNMKRGDFYGVASTWTHTQKKQMGVFLLKKALQIFLADGELKVAIVGGVITLGAAIWMENRIQNNFRQQDYYTKPILMLQSYEPASQFLGRPIYSGKLTLSDTDKLSVDGLTAK
ncbi:Ankyrin repeat and LEM domain-containing protein 1, partial [Bulinus truncatus]